MDPKNRLMNVGLNIIKYSGLLPEQNYRIFFALIYLSVRSYMIYLAVLLLIDNPGDMDDITDFLETINTLMQGPVKLVTLIFFRNDLLYLIKNVDKLWSVKGHPELYSIYDFTIKMLQHHRTMMIVIVSVFLAVATLTGNLPFRVKLPNINYAFPIIVAYQAIMLSLDFFYVVGVDVLFVGISINVLVQFHMLNDEMKNLNKDGDSGKALCKLRKCIQHHQVLIEYTETLAKAFRMGLLFQYGLATYSMCIEMYYFTERGITGMITSVFYVVAVTTQLGIYCFFAEEITETMKQTGFAIYNSEWHTLPVPTQKLLIHIIRASQRDFHFYAGGLARINKETFKEMFRTAISFYTLIKNVQDKNNVQ